MGTLGFKQNSRAARSLMERNRERAAKKPLLGPQSTKGEAGTRGLHTTSDQTVYNEVL